MEIKINKSIARGEISAPPSKSAAHRMLICAALAGEGSSVCGVELSKDIEATLRCIDALGIGYEKKGNVISFGKKKDTSYLMQRIFDCNESGSTLRFFIPIALADGVRTEFVGTKRLLSRPLDVYEEILKEQEIFFHHTEESFTVEGKLKGGVYFVKGDISSQFITGLLLALPLLGGGVVNVTGQVESRPYIEMTLSAMESFGINVERIKESSYRVFGKYLPRSVKVEGDWSNAAFLDALGLIGGNVTVTGLDAQSLQGDKIYKEYFEKIKDGYCTLDISDTPDLGPILMALGAAFNGVELTGTRRLKIKESDRGRVMAEVLGEFSIPVTVYEDSILVKSNGKLQAPTNALDGYNDHRVVMSEAILLTLTGGVIKGAEAVSKSYPDFFERIKELGIEAYKIG